VNIVLEVVGLAVAGCMLDANLAGLEILVQQAAAVKLWGLSAVPTFVASASLTDLAGTVTPLSVVTTPQELLLLLRRANWETIERTKTQPWCVSSALRILAYVPRKKTQGVVHPAY
jgi:hypothetical protein